MTHPSSLRLAAFIALLFALAGCASVGPDYRPPAVEAPRVWSRSPAGTPANAVPAPVARWWERLQDPLLVGLIDDGLAASPSLALAQAKLRQARALRDVAGAARYPTVGASGGTSRGSRRPPDGPDTTSRLWEAGFDASWEPDVFGGVRRGLEAAEADLAAGLARVEDAHVTLAAEIARNLLDLRGFRARLAITRSNLAAQAETLQLTQWRAQAGLVSSLEVEQARSSLEQTRATLPTLESGAAQAEHRLAVLLGQPPGALARRLAAAVDLLPLPEPLAIAIPADTLRQRPDVRAAERQLAAETARVGVAVAGRWPAFSLSGSLGVEALTLSALGNSATVVGALAAHVSGVLFDGGRLAARVEAQDAVREQALASYRSVVLSALEDVENALVALESARARQAALTTAVEAARNAALLARDRYTAGIVNFQTVLDTERTRLTVEDNLAAAIAQRAAALVQLYKALGGGWVHANDNPTNPS